jgi:hypothetical protein
VYVDAGAIGGRERKNGERAGPPGGEVARRRRRGRALHVPVVRSQKCSRIPLQRKRNPVEWAPLLEFAELALCADPARDLQWSHRLTTNLPPVRVAASSPVGLQGL